jgi:hypothetical protein
MTQTELEDLEKAIITIRNHVSKNGGTHGLTHSRELTEFIKYKHDKYVAGGYSSDDATDNVYTLVNTVITFSRGLNQCFNIFGRDRKNNVVVAPVVELDAFIEQFQEHDTMTKNQAATLSGVTVQALIGWIKKDSKGFKSEDNAGLYTKSYLEWLKVNKFDKYAHFKKEYTK